MLCGSASIRQILHEAPDCVSTSACPEPGVLRSPVASRAQVGQQTLVRSVPGELNTDKNEVLRLAQGRGFISKRQLIEVRKPGCSAFMNFHAYASAELRSLKMRCQGDKLHISPPARFTPGPAYRGAAPSCINARPCSTQGASVGLQFTDRGAALGCKACLGCSRTVWLGLHVKAAGHRGAMGI